mgnify:CR=1 FL=1
MVTIIINGNAIRTDVEGDLLSFLRNDMGLKSVKDGCNEGACGACKVLIDGTAKNSCSQKVEKQDGKSITTVEVHLWLFLLSLDPMVEPRRHGTVCRGGGCTPR